MNESTEQTNPQLVELGANADGRALVLSSTSDPQLLVRTHGTKFLVTDRFGNIAPSGARELGLFANDTRFLSHYALHVQGVELTHLSAGRSRDAYNQIDLMMAGPAEVAFLDDSQHYFHLQRRQLLDEEFVDEITLTSYVSAATTLELVLSLDADFADVFEVRGAKRAARGVGMPAEIGSDSVKLTYRGRDGEHYITHIQFSPEPTTLSANEARFRFELAAGETQRLLVTVQPTHGKQTHLHALPLSFGARADQLAERTAEFRGACTRIRCSHGLLQRVFEQSVSDLAFLRLPLGAHQILAAGIPWFCAAFGRDALITAYQTLLLNPSLAKESLRVLAAYQGRRFDPRTEEEPGRIFHELRLGEMARTRESPHSPYYGTIDATPLFVVLLDATYQVTADEGWLRELQPALEAALAWIDTRSEDGTRLVTYKRESVNGLDNQGWKDSRAAIAFPDGTLAQAPIALCEVQGYCVDAYARGAHLLSVLGKPELAQRYEARAQTFAALVHERFWLPDLGRYAYAHDGLGRTVPTVVSNLGHLLWSRLPNPDAARATADLLLRPESFSGFGIRTLAAGQPAYNPLSYHNGTVWPHDNSIIAQGMASYGLMGHVSAVFEGMIDAMSYFHDYRLPELFCGMPREQGNLVRYPVACSPQAWAAGTPFLLLQAVLGIQVDAPRRKLSIRSATLPPSVEWCELDNLRVGESQVHVRFRRVGARVHVDALDITGPHLRAEIEHD